MLDKKNQKKICAVCGKVLSSNDLLSGEVISNTITKQILVDFPNWSAKSYICLSDIGHYRSKYVQSLIESEKGELSSLESEVLESLRKHELLSKNIDSEFEQDWTFSERLADKIASFGGSWMFLIIFFTFLFIWIAINSLVFFWKPADPYPFIFLNLVLSCLAAIQAPIIMMSQNRQEVKDRIQSQHDYQVNLKAELEIRHLHEKVDHLLSHQWKRLVEIQEVQLELLSEINMKKSFGKK